MDLTIKFRRGSQLEWLYKNPILSDGEPGVERDTGRLKVGDGSTRWNDLPYVTDSENAPVPVGLEDHINSETPHPVYDDGPSFVLLYENAKV